MRRLLIAMAAAVFIMGCQQNGETKLGPDGTLEAFYKSLYSGAFDQAESLCDIPAMSEYVNGFRMAWEKNDSTIRTITSDILADISIEITDAEQNSQNRTVFYKMTATDGQNKEKIATLRKEEGAWKITAITDRH
jgi:PBP1b-binding outer membrane lipoprotein LpoB